MIRLAERLWIGSADTSWRDYRSVKIAAILNVAHDLKGVVGWPDVEYTQVGLIDGPGNALSTYYAAVLSLHGLIKRHRTLVICHECSRSMAVAAMYLNIGAGYNWKALITLLLERLDTDLPVPHEAHREAFDKMDWCTLQTLTK